MEKPCYLVSIFTLAWPEDSVVEWVQRITEVRLLKAVVVQNLQCVQHSTDCEAWSETQTENIMLSHIFQKAGKHLLPAATLLGFHLFLKVLELNLPAVVSWHLSKDQRNSTACPLSLICSSISLSFARTCGEKNATMQNSKFNPMFNTPLHP